MWTIFKVFIEFVTILFLFYVFMFWFFSLKACGILATWSGIEPALPALEGKVPYYTIPYYYIELYYKFIITIIL